MRNKLSSQAIEAIEFLDELCRKRIVAWPIDYESYTTSDSDIELTFEDWFGGEKWKIDGDSFVQLGLDGTGSMFLLWFYPGLNSEPPVVFLGSEGESYIVASNLVDFIQQLAYGQLFFDGSWSDPEADELDKLDWQLLKETVDSKFGKNSTTPEQLHSKALKEHPDFHDWVESKIEH